jgi:hypothetical protein
MVMWIGGILVAGFLSEVYFKDHLFISRFLLLMYASLLGGYIFKIAGIK